MNSLRILGYLRLNYSLNIDNEKKLLKKSDGVLYLSSLFHDMKQALTNSSLLR